MTRRSLSTLYRDEVRRNSAGVDAGQLLALGAQGDVDPAVLEQLARTPEAPALRGIARSIAPWSTALAEDFHQRNRCAASAVVAPRMHRLAWISLAAAASLALVMVGLQPRGEPDAPVQAMARPATAAMHEQPGDLLFADPDGVLIAAAHVDNSESIFADSLDL